MGLGSPRHPKPVEDTGMLTTWESRECPTDTLSHTPGDLAEKRERERERERGRKKEREREREEKKKRERERERKRRKRERERERERERNSNDTGDMDVAVVDLRTQLATTRLPSKRKRPL